jgi:hypothetical protein
MAKSAVCCHSRSRPPVGRWARTRSGGFLSPSGWVRFDEPVRLLSQATKCLDRKALARPSANPNEATRPKNATRNSILSSPEHAEGRLRPLVLVAFAVLTKLGTHLHAAAFSSPQPGLLDLRNALVRWDGSSHR